jgi:hypothetical protein
MGDEANKELLRYYPNRQIWYVDRSGNSLPVPYASVLAMRYPDGALSHATQ